MTQMGFFCGLSFLTAWCKGHSLASTPTEAHAWALRDPYVTAFPDGSYAVYVSISDGERTPLNPEDGWQ